MDHRIGIYITLLTLLTIAGVFTSGYPKFILIDMMIWGIYALSYDILYGYTGMFSYGQALYFGIGAYSIALPLINLGVSPWLSSLISIVTTFTFALLLGLLAVRFRGAYFVIITVILNVIFWLLAEDWSWLTGGDDGLILPLILRTPYERYYITFLVFISSILISELIVRSPLGLIFKAIRENEDRVALLGYNVNLYKLASYAISGTLAGLSGMTYALVNRYVSAGYFNLALSGYPIIWVLIGGKGTLIGALIGAFLIGLLIDVVSLWIGTNYQILIGVALIIILKTASKGIIEILEKSGVRLNERKIT